MGEPRTVNLEADHVVAGVFVIGFKAGVGIGFLAGLMLALCLASWVL